MNPRRVAVLLRQLADAMEEDEAEIATASEKRRPTPPPPPHLLGAAAATAPDRERARLELRRLGYRVNP